MTVRADGSPDPLLPGDGPLPRYRISLHVLTRPLLRYVLVETLLMLCVPDVGAATDRLLRPQAGLHRMSWESDPGVEFHLGHGDWLRLLRACARQWPAEEVWFAKLQR